MARKGRGQARQQQRRPQIPPAVASPGPPTPLTAGADKSEALKIVQTAVRPWLDKLEAMLGYPVIAYYLEDEGVPAQLADEQMPHLYEHLRRLCKRQRLGLWLSSRGGA